jgi:formylglycine-generating enzyme required for sulfatase activity
MRQQVTNSIGMKLVLIPAGEFFMGSPDLDQDAGTEEKPQHRVRITRSFYLGATEVTVGQFRRVVEATGLCTEAEINGRGRWVWDRARSMYKADPKYTWHNPGFVQTDRHPVVEVSWNDTIAFCNKLSEREGLKPCYKFDGRMQAGGEGYRLPTEAEWEYACRAGSTTRYSFGDDDGSLGEYAWYSGNSGFKTHPVGQKPPNAWGLYDMYGNIWEWCWDWYDGSYYGQSSGVDPLGPEWSDSRVYRGGSWMFEPQFARSASRNAEHPGSQADSHGFRVVRVQPDR